MVATSHTFNETVKKYPLKLSREKNCIVEILFCVKILTLNGYVSKWNREYFMRLTWQLTFTKWYHLRGSILYLVFAIAHAWEGASKSSLPTQTARSFICTKPQSLIDLLKLALYKTLTNFILGDSESTRFANYSIHHLHYFLWTVRVLPN